MTIWKTMVSGSAIDEMMRQLKPSVKLPIQPKEQSPERNGDAPARSQRYEPIFKIHPLLIPAPGLVQDCQSEGFPVPSATLSGVQSPTSNGNPQSPSASSSVSAIPSQTSGQSTTAPSGSSTGSQPLSTNTSSSTSGDGPAKSFIHNSLISNIVLAFYMFCYLGL